MMGLLSRQFFYPTFLFLSHFVFVGLLELVALEKLDFFCKSDNYRSGSESPCMYAFKFYLVFLLFMSVA